MKRQKNKYGIVRSLWVEWRRNQLNGFTNIPMLNFPSQTTEMRAYSGCVNLQRIVIEAPDYYPPDIKVKEFERGFRELKQCQKIAVIGKYVFEYTNCKTARIVGVSEGAIRKRLKTAEEYLSEFMGKILWSEDKLKKVNEKVEKGTNFCQN